MRTNEMTLGEAYDRLEDVFIKDKRAAVFSILLQLVEAERNACAAVARGFCSRQDDPKLRALVYDIFDGINNRGKHR